MADGSSKPEVGKRLPKEKTGGGLCPPARWFNRPSETVCYGFAPLSIQDLIVIWSAAFSAVPPFGI
jgi:hypothetical protein